MVPQPRRDKSLRFRLFRFRSPLLTESLSLSIPADTEMFHFSACRSFASIDSTRTWHCFHNVGLPHSETSGSKRVCRSPELIAAYCVLHSLMTPRHPSIALLVLDSNSEILGVQLTYVTRKNPLPDFQRTKFILLRPCDLEVVTLLHQFQGIWWAQMDLNHRPRAYQARALTN